VEGGRGDWSSFPRKKTVLLKGVKKSSTWVRAKTKPDGVSEGGKKN